MSDDCYSEYYPLFKINIIDCLALRIARKRIRSGPMCYVCNALPAWAKSTRKKVSKALDGKRTLEKYVSERLFEDQRVLDDFGDCRVPWYAVDRVLWIDMIIEHNK